VAAGGFGVPAVGAVPATVDEAIIGKSVEEDPGSRPLTAAPLGVAAK
jgi:hypothetical protein